MKFAWIDIRSVSADQRAALVEAAVHARIDGIVDDGPEILATLPPTVRKVLAAPTPGHGTAEGWDGYDVLLTEVTDDDGLAVLQGRALEGQDSVAAHVPVTDDSSLTLACSAARALPYTAVTFKDPTKIPLEIVIAAADKAPGQLICRADSLEEAKIILDVLEKGSEGILLAPKSVAEVLELAELLQTDTPPLTLTQLTVESIEHSGLGDRVCVDTCSYLHKDEGILVGSYSHGFILCSSETHPLPYMPTRPFRVNAGALQSYVLGTDNRTNYLSELGAGDTALAVSTTGRTRRVVVGRVKLESRPLLTIKTRADDGTLVSLAVQDDWHVRVLGPGDAVRNVTELTQGDQLMGYLATDQRHVGWPVGEFCVEK
ncbi:3-dehydroquinate synthase II family protein [Streptomyces halobius]|uniref:3-dehydroquinate synthase II n=1 Tax=Streptomyces halobius TaxID=2879846 RepID=A0ABY4MLQ5_9ACTN|nr:3-dehydroquinate synthase II family protein [Streptomyces halobius]UQA97261.1 3-dehydroquinate synthase II [Streptomyces halobius]